MKVKVSDFIVDFLKSNGIEIVFMVAGGTAAHLLDSFRKSHVKFVCCYHEQACAMAAEGYATISGKPACVLVTNGPGSSNTLTGIVGAFQSSVPLIVISGQSPTNQTINILAEGKKTRQIGVQECDIISMVKSVTKYAVQVTDPNEIKTHLSKAFQEATSGRMGPAWLDIPLDVQSAMVDAETLDFSDNTDNRPESSDYNINDIISLIINAKKPIIVTGNGIHLSKSEDLFLKLKNTLGIPVVSTWTSKDLLNHNDPLYVGNFGILGERAANFAIQKADLLLIIGSRMSIPNIGYDTALFSPSSIKIMVDIDKAELEKPTLNIDYKINDDAGRFISNLLSRSSPVSFPNYDEWVKRTQAWKVKYPVYQKEYSISGDGINSFFFIEELSKQLSDQSIVVTDMGTSFTCTMQSLKMNGKNRLFTSSGCCSMGFGLPGAIGAYYASPSKEIILIAGDGGFQMNIQELQTIFHNKIPIKIFILNNNGYLAISLMQDNLFNKHRIGSGPDNGVSSPDFVAIAKSYKIPSFSVQDSSDVEKAIKETLLSDTFCLCEIRMKHDQSLVPRVLSIKDEYGKIKSGTLDNMYPFLSKEEKDAL